MKKAEFGGGTLVLLLYYIFLTWHRVLLLTLEDSSKNSTAEIPRWKTSSLTMGETEEFTNHPAEKHGFDRLSHSLTFLDDSDNKRRKKMTIAASCNALLYKTFPNRWVVAFPSWPQRLRFWLTDQKTGIGGPSIRRGVTELSDDIILSPTLPSFVFFFFAFCVKYWEHSTDGTSVPGEHLCL